MKHLGLFEGIGGFSLAAKWAGWETVAWCEYDEFCQKILRKHFPEAEGYGDIKQTDFKKYANKIDIITGGFPCQPFSSAGKKLGTNDDRFLWPEMFRVIKEVKPGWVIGENVNGFINMALEQVCTDLESEGYEVQTLIIPACGIGAHHRRNRVWIIANANSKGLERTTGEFIQGESERFTGIYRRISRNRWESESGICGVADGIPNRVDRLRTLGNSIVPQVAYEIFNAINLLKI